MKKQQRMTLREIRKKENLTVKEAAEKMEVSEQYIYKIEVGKKEPGKKLIKKMSEVYKCTIEQIFYALEGTDSVTSGTTKYN